MRVIESMAESIWSWLAERSSAELAPVLADSTMRDLMELSRSETSERAPSVVAMTELALSEFLMPWSLPWMSERNRSEMIRPAVLADSTMRDLMELSRSETSERAPSVVAMTELALSEFLM